ncbi:hypothetical protein, partial [Paenibacillus dendritiformis]|uniref:hypothetical protein n=1 Tax=Paenibacillus dendritiformis TaxID=130049 RepID=UPI00387E0E3F
MVEAANPAFVQEFMLFQPLPEAVPPKVRLLRKSKGFFSLHFLCGGSRLSVEKSDLKRYACQVLGRRMDNLHPFVKNRGFPTT